MPGVVILVSLAMIAFAANSVFARLALGSATIDAGAYSGIRLLSGALTLALLLLAQRRSADIAAQFHNRARWITAAALFGYAVAFSYAYELIGAGMGALILFATVQISMLGWAVIKGDRPTFVALAGMALALCASVYLLLPGFAAPDPLGAGLMIVAGLSWAVYSLVGRGSKEPLVETACNFILTVPIALVLCALSLMHGLPDLRGVLLAMASGSLASGLGYAIWYRALPKMTRSAAAIVQLSVPVIAAIGGIIFIGETLTQRLMIASVLILSGLAVAITSQNAKT